MKRQFARLLGSTLLMMVISQSAFANVFINEFHYDNTGTDSGEFIEVAGTAGTDLTGWRLELYNGNGGASYNTIPLSGTLTNQCNGTGVSIANLPTNGLQNGAPDGIALVDNLGMVIEFISYEGSFTATDGPASGQTSTDIGISESATTPVGESLQLTAAGTWSGPAANTSGNCNTSQRLANVVSVPAVGPIGLLIMLSGLLWLGRRRKLKSS